LETLLLLRCNRWKCYVGYAYFNRKTDISVVPLIKKKRNDHVWYR